MANRRFLILVTSTLAVLAALVLAALLARTTLAELVATRAMDSAGLEHAAIRIRQFDTSQLVIASLYFTLTAGGVSRVEAHDIRVAYNPARLADGRLDRISIERLLLHHENSTAAPAAPLDQAALLQLLNTDWRGFVPFNTLTIDRIETEGAGFGPLENTAHRLQLHQSATAIETRLQYLGELPGSRVLIGMYTGDTLAIDLGTAEKSKTPALHASLKPAADGIDIDWRLQPAELKTWIEPYVHVADAGSGAGVNGTLKVDLSNPGELGARLAAGAKSYSLSGYRLSRPALSMDIRASTGAQDRRIDIRPGSYLRITGIESDTLTIGNTLLDLQAVFSTKAGPWSVDGRAGISRLSAAYTGYAFVLKDIQNRVHADAAGVSVKTMFRPEKLPGKFSIDVSHDFSSATGTALLAMPEPLDLDDEDSHLGLLLASWPFPFDLASGRLQLNGNAAWSDGSLQLLHAGAELSDVGGHYGELLFSGLNFRQQLDLLPAFKSAHPGELSLEHIDAGVAIEHISARIDAGASVYGALPKLFVNGLNGRLFGGDFIADPFAYDLNTPANALTIHAHGIDLAEVIAAQQFHDIEVSGKIDGDLPIELNPFGVFINNGSLHNASPEGVIRYQPAAGAGGLDQNPLTGIALKALSDFHYDTLRARANYVPDGTLTLNFELSGTSPPLQTTRPVHLNINTEQNLLSLLKSIRYVDGLNKGLDKRVREMYQRQTGN